MITSTMRTLMLLEELKKQVEQLRKEVDELKQEKDNALL